MLGFLITCPQRLGKVSSSVERQQHKSADATLFILDNFLIVADKSNFDKSNSL